jgi:hypothetical protein
MKSGGFQKGNPQGLKPVLIPLHLRHDTRRLQGCALTLLPARAEFFRSLYGQPRLEYASPLSLILCGSAVSEEVLRRKTLKFPSKSEQN